VTQREKTTFAKNKDYLKAIGGLIAPGLVFYCVISGYLLYKAMILVRYPLLQSSGRHWSFVLLTIWYFSTLTAMGVLPSEAEAILSRRSEDIGKIHAKSDELTGDIYDKYAAALDREAEIFRKSGDLENLLAVTNEQKAARELRQTLDETVPALERYRTTLRESLAKFEASEAVAVLSIDAEAVKSLIALRTQLTQAGAVEAAVAVDQQIKAIQGAEEVTAESTTTGERMAIAAKGQVADGDLFKGTDPWVGEYVLEPKRYLLRERIVLGRQGQKNESQDRFPATLYCPPGSRLEKGEIFVSQGALLIEGAFFKDMALRVGLGGKFEAQRALFENSNFQKGGGWFVSHFSSKWVFDNCVFSGGFVRNWSVANVGVKVSNCTFYDVEFSKIKYKKDAGDEAIRDWMTITGCRFVNCVIPESFLIATQNCVFEGCEFLEAESDLMIKTPIKTRIFVNDRKSLPILGSKREVTVIDATDMQRSIGAGVKHKRKGKNLDF